MNFPREISTLKIPCVVVHKLNKMGYFTVDDLLKNLENINSTLDFNINWENILSTPQIQEINFNAQTDSHRVLTLIPGLNDLMNASLKKELINEIVGLPGSGRTKLCMSICVSIQLPEWAGGIEGDAIYICTNSKFTVKRLEDITKEFIETFNSNYENPKDKFTVEKILKKIHHIVVDTVEELLACILHLKHNYLEKNPNIKLIVIDSIAYTFRLVDITERSKLLCKFLNDLRKLSAEYNLAILLINDMTTTVREDMPIIPYLGDFFYHLINTRMVIEKTENENHYKISVLKSHEIVDKYCYFSL